MQLIILGEQATLLASAYKKIGAGAVGINAVAAATKGLTAQNTMAVISTLNFSEAEKIQILTAHGVSEEEAKQIVTTYGLATAQNAGAASTSKFALAMKGLGSVMKAHPVITAVAAIAAVTAIATTVISNATKSQKEIFEDAQEASAKAKSDFEKIASDSKKLDDLIAKYKELAKSGIDSIDTRKDIREVQEEIVSLVGQHANGLDLVNGKLDDQIEKLREIRSIETQGSLDQAITAYHEAVAAEKAAISNKEVSDPTWMNPFNRDRVYVINDSSTDADEKYLQFLAESGFSANVLYDNHLIPYSISDKFDKFGRPFNDTSEKINLLNRMIEALKSRFSGDGELLTSDLYTALITQRDSYNSLVSSANTQLQIVMNQLLAMSEYDSDLAKITVSSAESYDNYRNTLIEKIKGNDVISQALSEGRISENDILNNIDSYLNTTDFADYYNEWEKLKQQKLKELFGIDVDLKDATIHDLDKMAHVIEKQAEDTSKTAEEVAEELGVSNYYENLKDFHNRVDSIKGELPPQFISAIVSGAEVEAALDENGKWKKPIPVAVPNPKYDDVRDWINTLTLDEFDIVYRISTEYTSDKVKQQLESYQEGGTIDLTARPRVDTKELEKAGWGTQDGDYATVYSSTYSNGDGTKAVNVTPILTDENGKYIGMLTPKELERYANDILEGTEIDKNIQIGAIFEGENAVSDAEAAARSIHMLHEFYYGMGDVAMFDVERWQKALQLYKDTFIDIGAAGKDGAFYQLLNDKGTDSNPKFIDHVEQYTSKIATLNEALNKFREGKFDNEDFTKLVKSFPELATRAEDLDVAINEVKSSLAEGISAKTDAEMPNMVTENDRQSLIEFRNALIDMAKIEEGHIKSLTQETTSLAQLSTAMKESASATGLSEESIANLNQRYKDLIGHETALNELYKNTSTGIHLNSKALRELERAYNNQQQTAQISKLQTLKTKYKDLTTEMRNASDMIKYSKLYNQRSSIAIQIDETARLISQYQALTSAYNDWQTASSTENPSDPYSNIFEGYDKVGKLIEQGWFNKDDVDTYLDLVLHPTIRTSDNQADYEKISKTIQGIGYSIKDFFIADEDGNLVTDGVFNFFKAVNQGLGSDYVKILSDGSYWWDFTGDKAETVAKYLGVSTEFVDWMQQAIKDISEDYTEESIISDLAIDAADAEAALTSLKNKLGEDNSELNGIYLNTSNLETANKYIDSIVALIKDNFIGENNTIDLSVNGAEDAAIVLGALIQQKAELTAPAVMSVDAENLTDADAQMVTAIDLLQQFIYLTTQLDTQKSLGLDTTDTQTQITDVATSLQNLPDEIKTKLGIDGTEFSTAVSNIAKVKITAGVNLNEADLEKIKSAITGIDSKTIELATNSKDIIHDLNNVDEFTIHDKPFKVELSGYDEAMENLKALNLYGIKPKKIEITTSEPDGDVDTDRYANGTAHLSGTAKISGDWGTAKGGKGLVGEEGREIIVDPRTGRWYTVGDNGAEFVDIPDGAIIFNHLQTESLLKNGYISGRGYSYLNGTAFLGGTKGVPYASGGSTGTAKARKAAIATAVAAAEEVSDAIPDGGDNNAEDSFKYIDRVEIYLDRIQRKIKNLTTSITDIFSLWRDRGNGITQQIRNVTDEIEAQQDAAQRYYEEARKQIDKYDLDPEWVKSLETGNLGFIYLTNLDELHEGYQEYLKWYGNATLYSNVY